MRLRSIQIYLAAAIYRYWRSYMPPLLQGVAHAHKNLCQYVALHVCLQLWQKIQSSLWQIHTVNGAVATVLFLLSAAVNAWNLIALVATILVNLQNVIGTRPIGCRPEQRVWRIVSVQQHKMHTCFMKQKIFMPFSRSQLLPPVKTVNFIYPPALNRNSALSKLFTFYLLHLSSRQ